eukprot:1146578-Pelagomonas_calceolata.AAC.5
MHAAGIGKQSPPVSFPLVGRACVMLCQRRAGEGESGRPGAWQPIHQILAVKYAHTLITKERKRKVKRKRKAYADQRPHALWEGPLTEKPEASPEGPLIYTRHSWPRREPETDLMRIWRVARHAPGRPDSPSPASTAARPENPPQEPP